MAPLLRAALVLKDEATSARALAESILPHADGIAVLDTGSTDGTQAILRAAAGDKAVISQESPIIHRTKRGVEVFDYAANRNRALELAESDHGDGAPVFTLTMSGDETLVVDGDALRSFLEARRGDTAGAYCVEMRTGTRSWLFPRVLRTGGGWRFRGRVHECPVGPDGEIKAEPIPGVVIVHAATDPERRMRRVVERDLPILEEIVADESLSPEARCGSMVFLAETHALIASDILHRDGKVTPGGAWVTHQMTAMSLYWRAAEIGEQPNHPAYDPAKVQYALAMYFSLAGDVPGLHSPHEMIARLQGLVQAAPHLPEARFLLAKHAARGGEVRAAMHFATEAVRAARDARSHVHYEVTDTSIEWRSLLLAADCALAMRGAPGVKTEDRVKRSSQARQLLGKAAEAGAPPDVVERMRAAISGQAEVS